LQTRPFIDSIFEYAKANNIPTRELEKYIDAGNWRSRSGGRGLANGGNRVYYDDSKANTIAITIRNPKSRFCSWVKALGNSIISTEGRGEQEILGQFYPISITANNEESLEVSFTNIDTRSSELTRLIRAVANKAAYCNGCRSCEVECPTSALSLSPDFVEIEEKKCVHCGRCLKVNEKGCVAAKSLYVSTGGKDMSLKGMNRYQTFGLRRGWLQRYLSSPDDFWTSGGLGNRQFDSVKVWFREAGIISGMQMTELGQMMATLGSDHPVTWAAIWTNLAHNSTIVKWYVTQPNWGGDYSKDNLVDLLGDFYSLSTRENAVQSLIETLKHSPLGEMGMGQLTFKGKSVSNISKKGWSLPERMALIYSLYVYAEKAGEYEFTLSSLQMPFDLSSQALSPQIIFGVDREELKRALQGVAVDYPHLIRVEFARSLDNIFLTKTYRSDEVFSYNMQCTDKE
jgi:Ferredoxin